MRSLLNDKKGVGFLTAIAGIKILFPLVLGLIVVLAFIFSGKFRIAMIGAGLIVGAFWIVSKTNNRKLKVGLVLGALIIGSFFIFSSGYLQSVLSVSTITESGGNVYWTFYASANKPNENYIFTYNPSNYVKKDGTKLEPQDNLVLTISPSQAECIYQMNKVTKKTGIFSSFDYYTLSNPEKVAEVEICERDNQCKTLDGTVVDSIEIKDIDGKGKVVIETQGLLSGKFNCPSQSNVAVVYNEKEDNYNIFYKNELDNYIASSSYTGSGLLNYLLSLAYSKRNLQLNSDFTSKVEDVNFYGTDEIKLAIDFGYPTFTITADQDYFNSLEYVVKTAYPKIISVDYNDEIKIDDSTSIKVKVKNKEDYKAEAIIKAKTQYGSISPTEKNIEVEDKTTTVTFSYKAPNLKRCSDIEFEVCGTSQFSSVNCDTEKIEICSIEEEGENYCGDGVCQSNEDYTTCPEDCEGCEWYEQEYTKTEKDYGKLYWRAYTPFIKPIKSETKSCKLANWVNLLAFSLILISVGSVYVFITFRKPKKKVNKIKNG